MKDKALIMMIAMYGIGFAILGVQWEMADTYGKNITINGVEIKSALHGYIKQDTINQYTENITTGNFTSPSGTFYDRVETSVTAGAFVVWELIGLMTGTYIFYILLVVGVPEIFVLIFVTMYVLLLARAIIGYLSRTN